MEEKSDYEKSIRGSFMLLLEINEAFSKLPKVDKSAENRVQELENSLEKYFFYLLETRKNSTQKEVITNFKELTLIQIDLANELNELTKHDTDVDTSTLTQTELKQALNNSITKFIEIYKQQPKELKTVLISYENTPLSEYAEATQNMIQIDKDLQLLTKLFKEYKRDTKGRVYNYSLFAFLYYAYGVYVSFEHLYNSQLLKILGAYTFKKDRQKPILKNTAKNILQHHQEATKVYQQVQKTDQTGHPSRFYPATSVA